MFRYHLYEKLYLPVSKVNILRNKIYETIILSHTSHGFETLSLVSLEELRFRVSEKKGKKSYKSEAICTMTSFIICSLLYDTYHFYDKIKDEMGKICSRHGTNDKYVRS
jgi:hypothetical protein